MTNKKTTTKIKLIEGKDYSTVKCHFRSNDGIIHYNGEEIKPEELLVEECYNYDGYNIENKGEYLSINQYTTSWGVFTSVSSFKGAVKENTAFLKKYPAGFLLPREEHVDGEEPIMQIRIYKDKKIAFLIQSGTGKVFLIGQSYGLDRERIEVFSDEEIHQKASKITKKLIKDYSYYLAQTCATDLKKGIVYGRNRYYLNDCFNFSEKTQKIVENFFGYNNPENDSMKTYWETSVDHRGICNISLMYQYLSFKDTRKAKKTKEETYEDLIKSAGLEDQFNNPEKYLNEVFWNRVGDEIVTFIPAYSSWRGNNEQYLFSFNIKTRKRKYGCHSHSSNYWSFPVPSLEYIDSNFPLKEKRTVIMNGLTIKELFAGTNCEWILNNAPKLLIPNCREPHAAPQPVENYINNNSIGRVCLLILISTGDMLLQQLLTAKLFNLYFIRLYRQAGYSMCDGIYFGEGNATEEDEYVHPRSDLPFNKKEKSLKKMFRICLNNFRILDSKLNYEYEEEHSDWRRPNICFDTFRFLFEKDLLVADSQMFKKALDRWDSYVNKWNYFSDYKIKEIKCFLKGRMDFEEKINFLEKYAFNSGSAEITKDYLSAREKIKKLSESKSELNNIYSDKEYPFAPKSATKFIGYRAEEWDSLQEFLQHYSEKYSEERLRGDLVLKTPSDTDTSYGYIVNFTPIEHMEYLHDEATRWAEFYEDAAKEEDFAKAVERVKPLEWQDEESGLCIIAPKKVIDVKDEGKILHHCVGGYVDYIIEGTENIMFLRRMDMPNHPFFTVDVVNGDIRQVHCYQNGCLTEQDQVEAFRRSGYEVYNKTFDIVGFLLKWAKAKKGKLKAESIHNSYGALCANR